MANPEYVIVGRIRKSHGVQGDVVVEPITDAPDAVFASGRRVFAGTAEGDIAADRRELTVRRSTPFKGGWIVAFAEIADRTEAELWRERYLLLPLAELTPPGDDEVFRHELLGMQVERTSGEPVGRVTGLYDLPQGLTLEVGEGTAGVLIPYRAEIVVRVDVEARVIVVDPPAGLLE